MLAMETPAIGIFHVGTGVETNVLALFRKISKLTGSKQKEAFIPAFAGEVMRSALDASKAAKELGWKAETRLDDGLAKTVEWFQKNAAGK